MNFLFGSIVCAALVCFALAGEKVKVELDSKGNFKADSSLMTTKIKFVVKPDRKQSTTTFFSKAALTGTTSYTNNKNNYIQYKNCSGTNSMPKFNLIIQNKAFPVIGQYGVGSLTYDKSTNTCTTQLKWIAGDDNKRKIVGDKTDPVDIILGEDFFQRYNGEIQQYFALEVLVR